MSGEVGSVASKSRTMPSRTNMLRPDRKPSARTARNAQAPDAADAHGTAAATHPHSGEVSSSLLFIHNPQPMYIYDRETLAFLDVNAAALTQYGYTREEFLRMCLTDIRPVDDIPRFLEAVQKNIRALAFRGRWRHRRKNGQVFEVEVTTQGIAFEGRDATFCVVQDIS